MEFQNGVSKSSFKIKFHDRVSKSSLTKMELKWHLKSSFKIEFKIKHQN